MLLGLPKDEDAGSTEVNASEWTDSEAKEGLAPLLKLAEKQASIFSTNRENCRISD